MQLVILAAGCGTRLGLDRQEMPKSLVEIRPNTPYLKLQLKSFSQFEWTKKIIVGGYGYPQLKSFLDSQSEGSSFCLVNNRDYLKGNLYSLLSAKDEISEGFFLFNADHFYSLQTYQKIFSHRSETITVFCDHDRELSHDDMKIKLDQRSCLIKMEKTLNDFEGGYVGVTYVPAQKLKAYWQACHETAQKMGDKANVESVLNQMAQNQEAIHYQDISGSWWTEIDTPEDLIKARKVILENI